MVAILGYSREQIFEAVKDMYTHVAEAPGSHFHFPVGQPAYRALGYAEDDLAELPQDIRESFAGVGCPYNADVVKSGDTVLDIGAGAGVDSLLASRRVGAKGHVIALDLTPAMTRKLRDSVTAAKLDNISVVQASAEQLPLADESVDAITSNGALNLVPDKRRAVREMFRVLKPGGRLQIADVVIRRPVTVDCDSDPRLWVECVVGATVEEDLLALFADAGFENIEVVRHFDYFAHSPSAQTREIAASFGARSIELGMRRGPRAPSWAWQMSRRLSPRRIAASLWRRGFVGVAGATAAVIACYGTLAAVALLPLIGVGLAVDETVWAGAIAAFVVLTALAVAFGMRRHRAPGPGVLAVAAAAVVMYALYVNYSLLVEFIGFTMLAGSVAWDVVARRRHEKRVLGLDRSEPGVSATRSGAHRTG